MKEKKIIFLDIDGVLNSEETLKHCGGGILGIDMYLLSIFNNIIFETDAQIVLSSTWRLSEEGRERTQKAITHEIFGITPNLEGLRGGEIKEWLKNNPKVKKYAILDDDSDMLPEQKNNFFQTSWKKGLTKEIALKVIKHLNK